MYKRIQYAIDEYNFGKHLEEFYGVEDLSLLHEILPEDYKIPDGVAGLQYDTTSVFHKIFYEKIDSGWKEIEALHKKFILEVVAPLFPEEEKIIYQSFPSFRIQYPKNRAITTVHTDSDENHKHPYGEINFFMPLTKAWGSNTVWTESFPSVKDYGPMEGAPGDLFMWDGNRCAHFNKFNETGYTRISFDFRVLPGKFYDPSYKGTTATTGRKFIIGDYYGSL